LNVGLSRAKNALYIVGNMEAMQSSIWSDEYRQRYATLTQVLDHITVVKLCVRDSKLRESGKMHASTRRSVASSGRGSARDTSTKRR
jgi:hypothetical protein